jgi:hypothetical protein
MYYKKLAYYSPKYPNAFPTPVLFDDGFCAETQFGNFILISHAQLLARRSALIFEA